MTQRARIEFGLAGGRCNSDAIDNSAGVNTSDVEVNIKIALGRPVRDGRMDLKKRNRLLVSMTGEVARLVLRNNYLQPLSISLAERRGLDDFGFQLRMMQELAGRGILNRMVEVLPDDAAMAERQKASRPLTRAEIGVLLAYAKIALTDDLVASDVVDEPALAGELFDYFPKQMREKHATDIEAHPLRREIIGTRIANSIVNRGGPTFPTRIADRTGASAAGIARAYVIVREAFGLNALNQAIDALDNKVSGATQLSLYRALQDLVIGQSVWFLRNVPFEPGTAEVAALYAGAVEEVGRDIAAVMPARVLEEIAKRAEGYRAAGVPDRLARRMARLPVLAEAPPIHLVATAAGVPIARAAGAFFAVAEHLHITRLEALGAVVSSADYYDGLALDRALATLADSHRKIAVAALAAGSDTPLEAWLAPRRAAVERVVATNAAMLDGAAPSMSRLTVAAGLLADLAR
jgi:glutamate dehydrogenase